MNGGASAVGVASASAVSAMGLGGAALGAVNGAAALEVGGALAALAAALASRRRTDLGWRALRSGASALGGGGAAAIA